MNADRLMLYLVDVLICTIALRGILGWLWAYPRLLKLIVVLVAMIGLGALILVLDLSLAGLLLIFLALPALIIMFLSFMPELSRIYQAASRGNIFRPKIFQSEEIIDELAAAIHQLAAESKGALLVFPGSQDVEGLISGGEEIDATINRSLIRSLFDPHAPRHDGAMVIANSRIVRIGAVLPLASAEGTEAHLGTRHLAALGLSERCDADVLVVSEERGTVSHAHAGGLASVHPASIEKLEEILFRILGVKREHVSKHKTRRWSRGLWLVALLLSMAGSYQVEAIKERYFTTPSVLSTQDARVEFLNPGDFFVEDYPQTVRLVLRSASTPETGRAVSIAIDLKDMEHGSHEIFLSESMVRGLQRDSSIELFEPTALSFRVGLVRRLAVPLPEPEFKGLSRALRMASWSYEPDRLQLIVRRQGEDSLSGLLILPEVDLSSYTEAGEYGVVLIPQLENGVDIAATAQREVRLRFKLDAKTE